MEKKNMEHIVQFAIGIDDEAIKNRIEENAEKTITNELLRDVKRTMFVVGYRGEATATPSTWMERRVDAFLENHKDEILEIAGKYLAEKLARTKAGKALLGSE